jgi:hypothetical protein
MPQISSRVLLRTACGVLTTAMLAALVSSETADGHARLAADELSQLRGSNQNYVKKGGFCNGITAGAGCGVGTGGAACTGCKTAFYNDALPGGTGWASGGGAAQSCGNLFTGVCQAGFKTPASGVRCQLTIPLAAAGVCAAPPNAPGPQPVAISGDPGTGSLP